MTEERGEYIVLQQLSLSELRERLNERGLKIGVSTLSELISDGDIAEQLGAQRKGNKLLFPPDAVDVLAAFIPSFRENPNFKNAARPAALRNFLQGNSAPPESTALTLSDIREKAGVGLEIVQAMQQIGLIPAPDDKLLTLEEARELYGVAPSTLRKLSVKDGGKRRVKRSAVLLYLRDL